MQQILFQDMFRRDFDVRNLSLSMKDKADFTSKNKESLGELFLGFLNYYANEHK